MMRLSTCQLELQLEELKAERKVLLDRLATIGLGGPLFSTPQSQDSSPATESAEELTEEEIEKNYIRALRPSQRAHYLERLMRRDRSRVVRPDVARMPEQVEKVNAALNQAEALGKKQA